MSDTPNLSVSFCGVSATNASTSSFSFELASATSSFLPAFASLSRPLRSASTALLIFAPFSLASPSSAPLAWARARRVGFGRKRSALALLAKSRGGPGRAPHAAHSREEQRALAFSSSSFRIDESQASASFEMPAKSSFSASPTNSVVWYARARSASNLP
eukprot:5642583-Prymnesium_polylepis.1